MSIHFLQTNNTQWAQATKTIIYLRKNRGSRKHQLGSVHGLTQGSKITLEPYLSTRDRNSKTYPKRSYTPRASISSLTSKARGLPKSTRHIVHRNVNQKTNQVLHTRIFLHQSLLMGNMQIQGSSVRALGLFHTIRDLLQVDRWHQVLELNIIAMKQNSSKQLEND